MKYKSSNKKNIMKWNKLRLYLYWTRTSQPIFEKIKIKAKRQNNNKPRLTQN